MTFPEFDALLALSCPRVEDGSGHQPSYGKGS